MKKLYLIFAMLYFSYSFGLAQWRIAFSSTYPSGTTFQSIYFVNENVGWAVGSDGIILKTTNGGNSWTQQVSNTTSTLYFIQALDENNLFACGGNRNFLKSTDGGNTWSVSIIDVIPEPTGTIKKNKIL